MMLAAAGVAVGVVLGGCESGSTIRDIDVVYRFDNVRAGLGASAPAGGSATTPRVRGEWDEIRDVLARHANTVRSRQTGEREGGGLTVRSYEAVANVPSVRTLEAIQADLEALAQRRRSGTGPMRFMLTRLEADYRSNVIAAGVQATISGLATPGFDVLVYAAPGSEPRRTRASRDGTWAVTLGVVPETRWVYAAAVDRDGKLPPAYSRINVSSRAQEVVEESDWKRMFPATGGAGTAGAGERAAPRERVEAERVDARRDADLSAHERRVQEEERRFRQREIEEQRRRKMRELDERTDAALKRAREAERRQFN